MDAHKRWRNMEAQKQAKIEIKVCVLKIGVRRLFKCLLFHAPRTFVIFFIHAGWPSERY